MNFRRRAEYFAEIDRRDEEREKGIDTEKINEAQKEDIKKEENTAEKNTTASTSAECSSADK